MHFYPNLTLRDTETMMKRSLKNVQNYIGEELYQEPDHPRNYWYGSPIFSGRVFSALVKV
jgi:hypothetical protein